MRFTSPLDDGPDAPPLTGDDYARWVLGPRLAFCALGSGMLFFGSSWLERAIGGAMLAGGIVWLAQTLLRDRRR